MAFWHCLNLLGFSSRGRNKERAFQVESNMRNSQKHTTVYAQHSGFSAEEHVRGTLGNREGNSRIRSAGAFVLQDAKRGLRLLKTENSIVCSHINVGHCPFNLANTY